MLELMLGNLLPLVYLSLAGTEQLPLCGEMLSKALPL